MSVESILLDFQVTPTMDESVYIRDVASVATCVADSLRQDCMQQGCISSGYSYASIYSGPKDLLFTIKHYFREGLITLSLEYFKISSDDGLLYDHEAVERMCRLVKRNLDATRGTAIPAIKRCQVRTPYLRTSDDRIVEYGWTRLLFSQRSPYQLVEIYGTRDFGNCLVLDGFINLAESDLAYTRNLMCYGKYDYKDKEALILGGGDGALLYELLKEKPKFVTMVDIDEVVIDACKEHMRSACGDVMDNYKGENYEIIVDDAFKYLAKYAEEKKTFDVIFGDLTDIPIHADGSTWNFVKAVIKSSLRLLPVGGKYFTHCIGVNATYAIANFEKMIQSLGVPVEVAQTQDHVPSFMEKWVWFQVTRIEGEITEEINDSIAEPEPEPQTPEVSSETIVSGEAKEEKEVKVSGDEKKANGEEKKVNGEEKKVNGDAKKDGDKKERASPDKKDEKKAGAKDLKDKLETPKGLTKEKSNVDKKSKPAKK